LGYGLEARMALRRHDFHFSHKLGQNFLLDEQVLSQIVDAAQVKSGDCILEIGPGSGTMTAEMASRGAEVLALELDKGLEPVLRDVLTPWSERVSLVFGDAMKVDLPALLKERFGGRPVSVVANLPYYITTDVVLRLLECGARLEKIVVMVQMEAAQRMMAKPGEKNYCALAAMVQFYGVPEKLLELEPGLFTPPPHVMSWLMEIRRFDERPVQVQSEEMMKKVISASFLMRRKTLLNNLCAAFSLEREQAARLISEAGLKEGVRGEALSLEEMGRLADQLMKTRC
jgi:16S rRNA (adenine1518-N6/adenine1519-N6)-dimethyltransferase